MGIDRYDKKITIRDAAYSYWAVNKWIFSLNNKDFNKFRRLFKEKKETKEEKIKNYKVKKYVIQNNSKEDINIDENRAYVFIV